LNQNCWIFHLSKGGLRRYAHAIFFERAIEKFSITFWSENKQKPSGWLKAKLARGN